MGQLANVNIALGGGLDLISTTQELAQNPGFCRELLNFESAQTGGYRRINGFAKFGDTEVNSETSEVLGVYPYATGIVACIGDGIYYTEDGSTYLQINKLLLGGGDSTALAAATEETRTSQGKCSFALYEGNTPYGELFVFDGVNEVFYIKFVGDSGSRQYYVGHLDVGTTACPVSQYGVIYKEHLVVVGDPDNPDTLVWSNVFEPDVFTGGTAGYIQLSDNITGIISWRDKLIVFGQNSISEIIDINGTPGVQNISRNIGCISGWTIQEIGGDIIWLAPDGFRNLAGTAKIDDIELASISRNIAPTVSSIVNNASDYTFSSLTVRSKNQYRFFYTNNSTGIGYGLFGTYKMSQQGMRWEWSKVMGFPMNCAISILDPRFKEIFGKSEMIFHGGTNGFIYRHDYGNDFDGEDIQASMQLPEIDYGDIGIRKTLHWIDVFFNVEGNNQDVQIKIRYDFGSLLTHQPESYLLDNIPGITVYGQALYGTGTYSANQWITSRIRVEGSGYSNNLKLTAFGTGAPFTVSNIYIRFYAGKTL